MPRMKQDTAVRLCVQEESSRAVASVGGHSTNSPPPIYKARQVDEGGEDRAAISAYVKWGLAWEGLLSVLDRCKRAAAAVGQDRSTLENPGSDDPCDSFFVAGGRRFKVASKGTKTAGPAYAFVVSHGGIRFEIMKRAEPAGDTPNVRIDLGSLPLMEYGGLIPVYAEALSCLEALGGELQRDKLSRVDVCLDLCNVSVSQFVEPFLARCRVMKTREWDTHYQFDKPTGLTVGRGFLLRIYDKVLEVMRDEKKWAALVEHRWHGEEMSAATRVEFQLNREALKSMDVDTVSDYVRRRGALAKYLCREWFRLTTVPNDGGENVSRLSTHPLWERVAQGFASWMGGRGRPIERSYTSSFEPLQLESQAIGCLVSLVAQTTPAEFLTPSEIRSLLRIEAGRVIERIDDMKVFDKFRVKRREFESSRVPFRQSDCK